MADLTPEDCAIARRVAKRTLGDPGIYAGSPAWVQATVLITLLDEREGRQPSEDPGELPDPRPVRIRCGRRWVPDDGEDATRLPCIECMRGEAQSTIRPLAQGETVIYAVEYQSKTDTGFPVETAKVAAANRVCAFRGETCTPEHVEAFARQVLGG